MLKRTVSLRWFFLVPTTYDWLRNKKKKFWLCSLIFKPDTFYISLITTCGWILQDHSWIQDFVIKKQILFFNKFTQKNPDSSFEHQKCMFKLMDKKTIKILPSKSLLIWTYDYKWSYEIIMLDFILINDTTFELSVFWPSDTESRINELRFSESVSLSFKTRLTSVTCF